MKFCLTLVFLSTASLSCTVANGFLYQIRIPSTNSHLYSWKTEQRMSYRSKIYRLRYNNHLDRPLKDLSKFDYKIISRGISKLKVSASSLQEPAVDDGSEVVPDYDEDYDASYDYSKMDPDQELQAVSIYVSNKDAPDQQEMIDTSVKEYPKINYNVDPWILSEMLMEFGGALSSYIEDNNKGTEHEKAIFGEPGESAISSDNIWETVKIVAYYSPDADIDRSIQFLSSQIPIYAEKNKVLKFEVKKQINEDWMLKIQNEWKPILLGDSLVVYFPWHKWETDLEPYHYTDKVDKKTDEKEHDIKHLNEYSEKSSSIDNEKYKFLMLEGGDAFGTGDHPTTRMAVVWLEKMLSSSSCRNNPENVALNQERSNENIHVIDYGSGSGILGFAALKFGAAASSFIEIDERAMLSSITNAKKNNFPTSKLKFYYPIEEDSTSESKNRPKNINANSSIKSSYDEVVFLVDVPMSHTLTIEDITSLVTKSEKTGLASHKISKDTHSIAPDLQNQKTNAKTVLVANIIARPLRRLAKVFYDMTKPLTHENKEASDGQCADDCIALTGILEEQVEEVIEAYKPFFQLRIQSQEDGWVLLTGSRK